MFRRANCRAADVRLTIIVVGLGGDGSASFPAEGESRTNGGDTIATTLSVVDCQQGALDCRVLYPEHPQPHTVRAWEFGVGLRHSVNGDFPTLPNHWAIWRNLWRTSADEHLPDCYVPHCSAFLRLVPQWPRLRLLTLADMPDPGWHWCLSWLLRMKDGVGILGAVWVRR